MKLRRLDPDAVRSSEPRERIVELPEKDLQHVSGAGCLFEVYDQDGNHVGTGHHPSYPPGG